MNLPVNSSSDPLWYPLPLSSGASNHVTDKPENLLGMIPYRGNCMHFAFSSGIPRRCFDPRTKKLHISRHVTFVEDESLYSDDPPHALPNLSTDVRLSSSLGSAPGETSSLSVAPQSAPDELDQPSLAASLPSPSASSGKTIEAPSISFPSTIIVRRSALIYGNSPFGSCRKESIPYPFRASSRAFLSPLIGRNEGCKVIILIGVGSFGCCDAFCGGSQYERVASSPLLFLPNMPIFIMPIEVTIDFASYSYYETRRATPLAYLKERHPKVFKEVGRRVCRPCNAVG
ncbi:hypothetical protein NE237_032287 [Protea cynaroides]|uniref:Uncharacterized protein n=1 Tax=Protea cynaroides TaxID=273540 RepID=A0A9Q0R3E2_9MAGN|nr:hypothetical protein NE237_032287 [Protea cynaroides]